MDLDATGVQLRGLPLTAGLFQHALGGDAATSRKLLDVGVVVRQITIRDDLEVGHAASIVEFKETETTFGISPRANPSLKPHVATNALGLPRFDNVEILHRSVPLNPHCVLSEFRQNTPAFPIGQRFRGDFFYGGIKHTHKSEVSPQRGELM